MASPAQLRMVESIWVEIAKPATDEERDRTLRAFLFKYFKVSHLKFIDLGTVSKILYALKGMKQRKWSGSPKTPQDAGQAEAAAPRTRAARAKLNDSKRATGDFLSNQNHATKPAREAPEGSKIRQLKSPRK